MKPLRRILAVSALALLAPVLVACGGSDDKGGSDASSDKESSSAEASASESAEPEDEGVPLHVDGFSVRLPSETTKRTESVPTAAGTLTVDLYVASDGDDGNYLVAITKAPNAGSVSLDGAVNGAATNVGGTVKSKENVTYAGYEGRDSRVTARAGTEDVTIFARFLQVDDKLFQLQYVVPGKDLAEPPAGYDAVLESIEFD